MNILILSWRDPRHPLAGGAEQSVWEHAKGWQKAGHRITWFASRFKGSPPEETVDSIEIVRGGCQYGGVQLAACRYYFKNRGAIDLVVDQFHGFPFFTPLYVSKPKLALIQEVAKKVWFLNPLPWPANWLVGAVGYLTEPLIFKFYGNVCFMTASESAKKDITTMRIPAESITVIPHGVTLSKLKIKRQKEKIKTITYLGILSRDKGIEEAIACFKILAKKGNYCFWVIGRGETKKYEKKIRALARPLGRNITFWGFVGQAKKFGLLSRSHLLVNPSAHEGWGLVNIEANSVGVPVVAYRSAGLIDSVKDGESGIIVEKDSPEELARTVFDILADGRKYSALSKGSLFWSRKFSWPKSQKMSLELINKVCNTCLTSIK